MEQLGALILNFAQALIWNFCGSIPPGSGKRSLPAEFPKSTELTSTTAITHQQPHHTTVWLNTISAAQPTTEEINGVPHQSYAGWLANWLTYWLNMTALAGFLNSRPIFTAHEWQRGRYSRPRVPFQNPPSLCPFVELTSPTLSDSDALS